MPRGFSILLTSTTVPAGALIGQTKLVEVHWILSQRFEQVGVIVHAIQLDRSVSYVVRIGDRRKSVEAVARIPFGTILCAKIEGKLSILRN